jgi:hypothetical protein
MLSGRPPWLCGAVRKCASLPLDMFIGNGSPRAKAVLAVVGVVLCGSVVVWSGAATTSSRAGAGAERGALAARTVPVEWDVYAVGQREASLELVVQHGACGHVQTKVVEGRESVVIEVVEVQGSGVCPAVAAIGSLDVQLAHALAGRRIQGASRQRFPTLLSRSRLDSVPRLIGFAPLDASHALALVSLHGRTTTVHGMKGLRRVVAQHPAPGQRTPESRIVRVTIGGR